MGRKRSASSSRWLAEHFKDQFVQKAHKQKLRSRAYFKLDEIQQTDRLFQTGNDGGGSRCRTGRLVAICGDANRQ